MTLPDPIPTPTDAQDLADRLVKLIAEPGTLHARGKAKLIAQYGSEQAIPLEAYGTDEDGAAGYERAAEVLVEAAVMAFNLAAKEMGVTGAQGGWAAMNIVGQLLSIDGPARLVQAHDYLYPQHEGKVTGWLKTEEMRDYLVGEALAILADRGNDLTRLAPRVQEHLTKIATEYDTWQPRP